MQIHEVISPLKKFLAVIRVKNSQAKTVIEAETQTQARMLLSKMYGASNVVSVTSVSVDESLDAQPTASQLKHAQIISSLTDQITRNANTLRPTKRDFLIAYKRYKTKQKRANLEYERQQRLNNSSNSK